MKYEYVRGYCNKRYLGDTRFLVHVFDGFRMIYSIWVYPRTGRIRESRFSGSEREKTQ